MSSSEPLTLTPGGARDVVTEEKAKEIVSQWKSQILTHQTNNPTLSPLCTKIDLSNKSYTSDAARVISDFLTSTDQGFSPSIASGIQIADLHDIIASRPEAEGLEVLKVISDMFAESTLIEVDLSDNAMGSKGITACQMVLNGEPVMNSLEQLSLCNMGLSRETMDEIANLLTSPNGNGATCIAQNLTKIHFYNNMSGPDGCKSFQRIMNKCTNKITDIRFSSTRAQSEGSAVIAETLSNLSSGGKLENLTRLDLVDNVFSESYSDLANALSACTKLEYLHLSDCMIAEEMEGLEQVCDALMTAQPPLKGLSLTANDIDNDGAKLVAKLVKSLNGTIEVLEIEANELKSSGVKRIVKNIDSSTLKELNLKETECGDIGAAAIIQAAPKMPNLNKLLLDENYFTDEMVDMLRDNFGETVDEMEDNRGEDDEDEDDEDDKEKAKTLDSADVNELSSSLAKVGI